MTNAKTFLAALALAALVALLTATSVALPATALAQVAEYHNFIGKATLDGSPVAVGTEITAYDNTRAIGTALVQTDGQFRPPDHPLQRRHLLPHRPGPGQRDLRQLAPRRRHHQLRPDLRHAPRPDPWPSGPAGSPGSCRPRRLPG